MDEDKKKLIWQAYLSGFCHCHIMQVNSRYPARDYSLENIIQVAKRSYEDSFGEKPVEEVL